MYPPFHDAFSPFYTDSLSFMVPGTYFAPVTILQAEIGNIATMTIEATAGSQLAQYAGAVSIDTTETAVKNTGTPLKRRLAHYGSRLLYYGLYPDEPVVGRTLVYSPYSLTSYLRHDVIPAEVVPTYTGHWYLTGRGNPKGYLVLTAVADEDVDLLYLSLI